MTEDRRQHWNQVYGRRGPAEVSWFEATPGTSLELIHAVASSLDAPIIDVGGGASLLCRDLLSAGYTDITVLDVSTAALEHARAQLEGEAGRVAWLEADVTRFSPKRSYAVWHDRACLHFLTDERAAYRQVLSNAVAVGGHAILGGFAPTGPERCSGLPVVRLSPEALSDELGDGWRSTDVRWVEHQTPGGAEQSFVFCVFERVGGATT